MLVDLKSISLMSALRPFGRWWLAECRALVPARLARWVQGRTDASLWLSPRPEGVTLRLIGSTRNIVEQRDCDWASYSPQLLASIFKRRSLAANGPIVIHLPERSVFRRNFLVPIAARSQLAKIAQREIEQRTPFRVEDIYLDHRVEPAAGDIRKLQVRQRIVRKDLIEEAKSKLGIGNEGRLFAACEGDPLDMHAAMSLQRSEEGQPWPRAILIGLLACAVLPSMSIVGSIWWRQQAIIDDVAQQLPALQAKAQQVRHTLDEIGATRNSIQSLADRRASPTTLRVWAELTQVLPDGSWLTSLTVEGSRLSISGYSDNATGLVKVLGASPLFSDVALSAPITSDPIAGRDRVSLVATIKGRRSTGTRS